MEIHGSPIAWQDAQQRPDIPGSGNAYPPNQQKLNSLKTDRLFASPD